MSTETKSVSQICNRIYNKFRYQYGKYAGFNRPNQYESTVLQLKMSYFLSGLCKFRGLTSCHFSGKALSLLRVLPFSSFCPSPSRISSSLCGPSLPLSASSITAFAPRSANPCREAVPPAPSLTNQLLSCVRVGGTPAGTLPAFLSLSVPLVAEVAVSPMLPGSTHMLRHRRAGTVLDTQLAPLFQTTTRLDLRSLPCSCGMQQIGRTK